MSDYESNIIPLECGHDLVYLWQQSVGSCTTFGKVTCPICTTTVRVLQCDDPAPAEKENK